MADMQSPEDDSKESARSSAPLRRPNTKSGSEPLQYGRMEDARKLHSCRIVYFECEEGSRGQTILDISNINTASRFRQLLVEQVVPRNGNTADWIDAVQDDEYYAVIAPPLGEAADTLFNDLISFHVIASRTVREISQSRHLPFTDWDLGAFLRTGMIWTFSTGFASHDMAAHNRVIFQKRKDVPPSVLQEDETTVTSTARGALPIRGTNMNRRDAIAQNPSDSASGQAGDLYRPEQYSSASTYTTAQFRITASLFSPSTFVTARSNNTTSVIPVPTGNFRSRQSAAALHSNGPLHESALRESPWRLYLANNRLLPDAMVEQNWSGRGQHAEFKKSEEDIVPLHPCNRMLGSSASAVVDVVRCKRVLLARKTIRCRRQSTMQREDAAKEVAHLQRLNHAHIVRVIGTYVFEDTISKDLHILLYPVADYDLETFMEGGFWTRSSLCHFFNCLARTLAFLHSSLVKHMDIKPRNVLVKLDSSSYGPLYKVYLTDFGISRSYKSALDAETSSPTSFTRIYAAPEVVAQDTRGFKADVFSLGCIYAEMLSTLEGAMDELLAIRNSNPQKNRSYHANIEAVRAHLRRLSRLGRHPKLPGEQCLNMIDANPDARMSSEWLTRWFDQNGWRSECCDKGADRLEASYEKLS